MSFIVGGQGEAVRPERLELVVFLGRSGVEVGVLCGGRGSGKASATGEEETGGFGEGKWEEWRRAEEKRWGGRAPREGEGSNKRH